jgi:hypothetical protein
MGETAARNGVKVRGGHPPPGDLMVNVAWDDGDE